MSGIVEPRKLRALILDFDHTLTDFGRWVDWQGARAEIMALYRGHGLDPEAVTKKAYAFGLFVALDEALAGLTSRANADTVHDEALAILERFEQPGAERATWLPGAEHLLDLAAVRGIALAIVSANGEVPIRDALRRLDAEHRFATILGRSRRFSPKPAPAMHNETLRRLGITADAALGIGDSPNDMRAATAANILTIGVLGGEGNEERLFKSGATWVLEDLTVLPALLELWSTSV